MAQNILVGLLTARPSTSCCDSHIRYCVASISCTHDECLYHVPRLASGRYDMRILDDYGAIKYLEYELEQQSANCRASENVNMC